MRNILLVAATLFLGACGNNDTQSDVRQVSESDGVHAGQFILRTHADIRPTPSCDIFRKLTLTNTAHGPIAYLSEQPLRDCGQDVAPTLTTYQLTYLDTGCGSLRYSGSPIGQVTLNPHAIIITDHRLRTCRDLVPARLLVDSVNRDGETMRYYGSDFN